MKQFFKFIFASCLGTMLALAFIVFIITVIALATSGSNEVAPSEGLLHLQLDQITPELTDNVEQQTFDFEAERAIGVNDIVRLIRIAKNDKNIKGILINTEVPQLRPATAQYIADVLREFEEDTDKMLLAYGNYFTQSGYMMAAVADTIRLNPNGLVDLRGYGTTIPYFKDFSDKTGIQFDVYHAGQFKSAVEPYYLDKSSAANRYQTQQYLGAYHDQLATHISECRGLSHDRADEIIRRGLAQNAQDALSLGLVDKLEYYEDIEEYIQAQLGVDEPNLIELSDYLKLNPKQTPSSKNKIAVIYAEGQVAGGGNKKGEINMEVYESIFEKIEKDEKYKAIVLRVNSPGGSAFTSDVFLRRIQDLQAQGRYVVASFGDYAASGGYYISASADKIVSEPTTLTGSIGVFSLIPSFNTFFDKQLGIDWDSIGTGERTFLYSTMIDRTSSDDAILQSETERTYHQFKTVVAEGRGMTLEAVDEIGQGRVWSGNDALQIGLVDEIGTLDDAIRLAAEGAQYDGYKVMNFPVIQQSLLEQIITDIAQSTNTSLGMSDPFTSKLTKQMISILDEVDAACREPQARLPFHISMN